MGWPNDADGDVMRRLVEHGFDFDKPYWIDFNIDFARWPPLPAALAFLEEAYPAVTVFQPDGGSGYVQVRLFDKVSYDLVVRIQTELSGRMAPFGGICESWGVLQQ